MSEYGDIGYIAMTSVEESCYAAMRECQLAVLIVGKRYGTVTDNELSITHNEFRTARQLQIPVISIVDSEVLTFKRIYDANRTSDNQYPGMEAAKSTFSLISEIQSSPVNNAVLAFTTVFDAQSHLKRQLAHLFGELLKSRFDPVTSQLNDVLSEIKTLRHELLKDEQRDYMPFMRVMRYLLNSEGDSTHTTTFRDFIVAMAGDIDTAAAQALESTTFDDFARRTGVDVCLVKTEVASNASFSESLPKGGKRRFSSAFLLESDRRSPHAVANGEIVFTDSSKVLYVNNHMKNWLLEKFSSLKKASQEDFNITSAL